MFLDLFSTMVGSFGTIIIEAIVIGLIMLWALMSTGKKADEQMFKPDGTICPFRFEYGKCSRECMRYEICEGEYWMPKHWKA